MPESDSAAEAMRGVLVGLFWRLLAFKLVVTVGIIGYAAGMIYLRIRESKEPLPSTAASSASGAAAGGPAVSVSTQHEGVAAFIHRLMMGNPSRGVMTLLIELWLVSLLILLLMPVVIRFARMQNLSVLCEGGMASV